jgi:hypothetical protein
VVYFGSELSMASPDSPPIRYLSPDGKEFYFMRQTGEDRSTRDIWVSYRLD